MEKFLLISCLATAGTAIFFPFFNMPNQKQMMNICIYSVNPTRYQPKCFLCPSSVYPNVLRACVNAAAIPSNVSYTQASCIEQNCMISRGKRSIDDQQSNNQLLNDLSATSPGSLEDNEILPQEEENILKQQGKYEIVGMEELFASDYAEFDEDDFELDEE